MGRGADGIRRVWSEGDRKGTRGEMRGARKRNVVVIAEGLRGCRIKAVGVGGGREGLGETGGREFKRSIVCGKEKAAL